MYKKIFKKKFKLNLKFYLYKDLKNITNKMANLVNKDLEAISVVRKSWGQQFSEAMNVNGGDKENATVMDYIMHVLAFPWKVMNQL